MAKTWLAGVLIGLWACGNDPVVEPPPEASCTNVDLPDELLMPNEMESPIRGNVSVKDRRDYTLNDQGVPKGNELGIIQGTFAQLSTAAPAVEMLMPLGVNCLGRVSRSSVDPPTFLPMDGLTVRNTRRGDVMTMSVSEGRFTHTGALILDGATGPRAVGTQSAGGAFPAFDEAMEVVESIELTSPSPEGPPRLEVNELLLRWTGQGGQGVLITIIPQFTGMVQSGGQVVCQVVDDGCFTLPAAANYFLLGNKNQDGSVVERFTLVVERYRISFKQPAARTVLTLDSSTEYRLTLQNGVD